MKRPDFDVMRAFAEMEPYYVGHGQFGSSDEMLLHDTLTQACEYIRWVEGLLEKLTPGGSEFHQVPLYCAAFVKTRLESLAPAVLKKKIKEAESERDRLSDLLSEISDMVGGPSPEKPRHLISGKVRSMTARVALLEHELRGFGFDVNSIPR